MFLTSRSGTVRVDPVNDPAVGQIERRLSHALRRTGLIVLTGGPGLVTFTTPTVTDGKTWWWMGWGPFATVSGGSFAVRDNVRNIIAYRLSLRRLLFWSIPGPIFFLAILIAPSIAQHNPFPLLIPIGFWLLGYFGNRFVLRFRIRRWVHHVVASTVEAGAV
jgi:hypothetical protein